MIVPDHPVCRILPIDELKKTRAPLGEDEVRLFLARPDGWLAAGARAEFDELLSNQERTRRARFWFEQSANLFTLARGVVRLALAHASTTDPTAWRFEIGEYGQPLVAWPPSPIQFSISHTRGLVACALSLHRVGIDVESGTRSLSLEIAEHFFSAIEIGDVHALPGEARPHALLKYWTLKEAYTKALGRGLFFPFDQFALRENGGNQWRLTFAQDMAAEDLDQWDFLTWAEAGPYRLGLAAENAGKRPLNVEVCEITW